MDNPISILTYILLALAGFGSGFVDAIIGGGGLIQIPALLVCFPQQIPATIFGTGKIAAFMGTSVATWQYSKKIKFNYTYIIWFSICAAFCSWAGANLVHLIDVKWLKPIILCILIIMAVYTFFKKQLGYHQGVMLDTKQVYVKGGLLCCIVGFYDGFFGPGTGSFLVLGCVAWLQFDFLHASAYSKWINCITNLGALTVFIYHGNYMLSVAVIMALSNMLGGWIGSKMAIKKGNEFIKRIFLIIVTLLIAKFAYDVWQSQTH